MPSALSIVGFTSPALRKKMCRAVKVMENSWDTGQCGGSIVLRSSSRFGRLSKLAVQHAFDCSGKLGLIGKRQFLVTKEVRPGNMGQSHARDGDVTGPAQFFSDNRNRFRHRVARFPGLGESHHSAGFGHRFKERFFVERNRSSHIKDFDLDPLLRHRRCHTEGQLHHQTDGYDGHILAIALNVRLTERNDKAILGNLLPNAVIEPHVFKEYDRIVILYRGGHEPFRIPRSRWHGHLEARDAAKPTVKVFRMAPVWSG